jgi:DNA-binding NarL/FixJ family response regulator
MGLKKEINVLVVEDDFLISEEIARVVNRIGFNHIGTAQDSYGAIDMIQTLHPDIILMDIKIPGDMDGLDVSHLVQNFFPTPVIILSAYESKDLFERASESGVAGYLTKPPQPQEIERAIYIALARHNELMEYRRLNKEINKKNEALKRTLKEIKTLRGLIPICSFCKKIRDKQGCWLMLEKYIYKHTEAHFSHSICPDCLEEQYPDIDDDIPSDPEKKKKIIH